MYNTSTLKVQIDMKGESMFTDIIAIMPEQVKGKGIYSRIYKEDESILDQRTPALFLKNLYEEKGKSKKQMDKKIKATYQIYRNIPYVIDANQVFFPFKIRNTPFAENNRVFINVKYVSKIKDTTIVLVSGEEIQTLSNNKSLIQNRNLAKALHLEEILVKTLERESSMRYVMAYLRKGGYPR